jgi:hypothetical protein
MPWWPLWGAARRSTGAETDVRQNLSAVPTGVGGAATSLDTAPRFEIPAQRNPDPTIRPVTAQRIADALDRLEIRYLTDGDGSLLALWERHALLFALEGPDDEILVMRGRPHATVPPDWADRAHRVVNEWNHTRRFCKAYIGDATERGQLPIYAEIQVPLLAGAHDALLDELLDCAAAVTSAFVDWLYDEGSLL